MSTPNDDLASKVGIDKTHDPRDVYDQQHGSYSDPTVTMPVEKKIPMLPQGDESSPFKIGGL